MALCMLVVEPFTIRAENYTEITVELNSTWRSQSVTNHHHATATCIVGSNGWFFSGDFIKNAKADYWLVGKNVIEHRTITSSMYLEQVKEFVSEQILGERPRIAIVHSYPRAGETFTKVHPSPLGEPVFHGMEGVIWLAFCSGDYLSRSGRQIPMPIGPSSQAFGYADKTILFDEHGSLPKTVQLFATNGMLACHYEVLAATNYNGRTFPVHFLVVQRGQPANGGVRSGSTTELEGRAISIRPGKWRDPPDGASKQNAGISKPIAEVIPAASGLGPGWESQIEVLVDSETTPFQTQVGDGFSEATVSEWRRSAADPSEPLSGWGRARFDFKSEAATNQYYVQVERFRSQTALTNRWARLAQVRPGRQSTFPRSIGEGAFVTHEDGSIALWFRRGSFIVNVSSFGATPPEDVGGSMRRLAKMADNSISGDVGTPGLIILTRKREGEPLRTAFAIPGSPAEKAGIRPGGFLIAVDGTNVVNMSLREAISRVRGAVDSFVTLHLADSSMAQTNKFTVKRAKLVHTLDRLEVMEE